MTKRELVIRIAKETGLVQTKVAVVVQKTLDFLSEELAAGKTVELRNFGVFEVKLRKGRTGRNPRKPEIAVPIPARKVVKFRAGRDLKARVATLK